MTEFSVTINQAVRVRRQIKISPLDLEFILIYLARLLESNLQGSDLNPIVVSLSRFMVWENILGQEEQKALGQAE